MMRMTLILACVAVLGDTTATWAQSLDSVQLSISQAIGSDNSITVVPFEFDPNNLNLAKSTWLSGTGCAPTGGTDPLCTSGNDPKDKKNEGLFLAKTGSTGNVVAAGARINGVKGTGLTVLGYDLRKPVDNFDPRGSHCGAGAPRFNIVIAGATYFIGCNSPQPAFTVLGLGWIRLRWGGATGVKAFNQLGILTDITGMPVDAIQIIFDEGQDTGPDNFGAAILDNITINDQVAGRGPGSGS